MDRAPTLVSLQILPVSLMLFRKYSSAGICFLRHENVEDELGQLD